MRRAVIFACAVSCIGCGRVGFDERPPPRAAHVATVVPWMGRGSLILGDTMIDTSSLTFDGSPAPDGAWFGAVPQPGGGPELAVLEVDSFTVLPGATVRIVGTRPFVAIARGDISIDGAMDVSARGSAGGAGSRALPDPGAGGDGAHDADVGDGGGGGGGSLTAGGGGGLGGTAAAAGTAGAADSDAALAQLHGGAPGGRGGPGRCAPAEGGGGGGALQLTSGTRITITPRGVLTAGGGGGAGGLACEATGDGGGGGGGGAGGAIYLEAPVVVHRGVLAVNGGAGGGGGNGNAGNGPIGDGGFGEDGTTSATAAVGGAPPAPTAGTGGAGAAARSAPTDGQPATFNAGGGGGAGGSVVIVSAAASGDGLVTPTR